MSSILIVEDEEDIQELVHRLLTANGFEVFKASTGEEGLIKAVKLDPDLVILDLMMPGMSGLEVCRLLKLLPGRKDTPIMILSALNRRVDRDYAEDAGADLYMSKPFNSEDLLMAVDELLNKK